LEEQEDLVLLTFIMEKNKDERKIPALKEIIREMEILDHHVKSQNLTVRT